MRHDTEEDDDVNESQPLAVQTTTRTHKTTETTLAGPATWDGFRLCDLSATMSGSLFEPQLLKAASIALATLHEGDPRARFCNVMHTSVRPAPSIILAAGYRQPIWKEFGGFYR